MSVPSPDQRLNDWLKAVSDATSKHDVRAAMRLFVPDVFLRDLAAFTWNITTVEGQDTISDTPEACLTGTAPHAWHLSTQRRLNEDVVEATGMFEMEVAHCRAVIRIKDG